MTRNRLAPWARSNQLAGTSPIRHPRRCAFDQQFDAVAEATVGLDRDGVDHAAREQPEAVAGVVRRQSREMVEREIAGAHKERLERGAADHAAAGHETAGADDIAAALRHLHHGIEHAGVVIVVGRKHERERRVARSEPGQHRTVRAPAAIAHELDGEPAKRLAVVTNRRQGVIVLAVVADQHPERRRHRLGQGLQGGQDIGAFVVHRDDDVEAWRLCRIHR